MDQGFEPEQKSARRIKVGFPCNQCEYVATRAYNLKIHFKSKHEGVRHPCPECEFAATRARGLKIHIERKHEGLKYPCPNCEYAATTAKKPKDSCKK